MTDPRTEDRQQPQPDGPLLQNVSNAMVALHKEQFGRGPTHAQSHFAGPDALLCILQDALLPAERTMVKMGEQQRVRESRMFLQVATADAVITVRAEVRGDILRLEEADLGDSGSIAPCAPDLDRGGGFGLHVVEVLSRRWGVSRGAGTRVWAELDFAATG